MEEDKFDKYTIEIMKTLLLINGGAIIVVTSVIGNIYDTEDD